MSAITTDLPSALDRLDEIRRSAGDRRPAVFLDYDGTLTPIVERPELAVLSDETRQTVRRLARQVVVAIISGRDLRDVRNLVGLDGIYYAGSHGFEIEGPKDMRQEAREATKFLPALDAAENMLRGKLAGIQGALVERKRFSVAIHYRLVHERDHPLIESAVKETAERFSQLRRGAGKKVHELQPRLDWNKGKALSWLLKALALGDANAFPIFIGDDVTDEDGFQVLTRWGAGIVVRDQPRSTAARYSLGGPDEVCRFLEILADLLSSQGL